MSVKSSSDEHKLKVTEGFSEEG